MIEQKIWGRVHHLFTCPEVAISHLEVIENSWCSIHYHQHRVNHFILLSGLVDVLCFASPDDQHPEQVYCLKTGDSCTIGVGVWHQFHVAASGRMIEVYWSADGRSVSLDDIIRHTEGGRLGGA